MKREDLEHIANTAALVRPRVEFAITVGSRSSFPEAVVAVGVDAAVAKERLQIMSARLDGLTAVEHCRANPRPCQSIGAHESCRAIADHQNSVGTRDHSRKRAGRRLGRSPERHRQMETNRATSRVDRAPAQRQRWQGSLTHSQPLRDLRPQPIVVVGLVEPKPHLDTLRKGAE